MPYIVREVDGLEEAEDLSSLHRTLLIAVPKPDFSLGWWYLAYSPDGAPVAYAGMIHSEWQQDAAYLCAAGVLPTDRGHGLQRRLILAREKRARKERFIWTITDTVPINVASNNNLISAGYKMFKPIEPWTMPGAIFWRKRIV